MDPYSAVHDDLQFRSKVVVGVNRLCVSFGQKYFACVHGYSNEAGTLTAYAARGTTPDGVATTTLLTAGKSTCSSISLTFWGDLHSNSTVSILTTSGTYRATSRTNHPAVIRATLKRGPFKVSLTQHQSGTGGVGRAYFNGTAKCTTTTGLR